jgi:hypothetical protein
MTMDDQDLITTESISYDLSEASSVTSTDTEDTDLRSNVTKMQFTSPNDGPSYDDDVMNNINMNMNMNHQDNCIPRLGDPLPIVTEGKILQEEYFEESNEYDGAVKAYQKYEKEEAEFATEMNTTKIAFSAYRNAVLHLIHHQNYVKRKKEEADGVEIMGDAGDNDGDAGDEGGDDITQGLIMEEDEEDANLRMTILEEIKAKACFLAVPIAKDFMERGSDRQTGRTALFQELLNTSHGNDNYDDDDDDDIRNDIGNDEIVQSLIEPSRDLDVVKMEGAADNDAENDNEVALTVEMPKIELEEIESSEVKKVAEPKTKKQPSKDDKKAQTFVKRRKSTRHVDCIRAKLPKFKYRIDVTEEEDQNESEDKETPASYGTTSWIGKMIKWRSQRKTYKSNSFEKCGCPDCFKELKGMAM